MFNKLRSRMREIINDYYATKRRNIGIEKSLLWVGRCLDARGGVNEAISYENVLWLNSCDLFSHNFSDFSLLGN